MAINLNKGQTIDLRKPDGGGLTRVRMGLGWDAKTVTKKTLFGGTKTVTKSIDLDASALLCAGSEVVETVYFGHLRSDDGSLQHTGDNLTGAGDGDDESIVVDLPAVDSTQRDNELARFSLTSTGPHTAMVMAKVTRSPSGWTFTAIGHPGQGRRASDLATLITSRSW